MDPQTPLSIAQWLQAARQMGVDRLDAQMLLSAALKQPRAWLLAHDEACVPAQELPALNGRLQRRAQGEPLAYILGDKEFFGLSLSVSPSVLIPRPDTEVLVNWALDLLPCAPMSALAPALRVLDLGTGSGAIALAIQHQRPHVQVTAVDASEPALQVARRNAQALHLAVRFLHGHWLSPLASERFDLIVSNPPYIAEGDAHLPALRHEPLSALTAGPDGLSDLRHIVSTSVDHLVPGGWLLLEHGHDQAQAVAQLLTQSGYLDVGSRTDLGAHLRCTGGRRPV